MNWLKLFKGQMTTYPPVGEKILVTDGVHYEVAFYNRGWFRDDPCCADLYLTISDLYFTPTHYATFDRLIVT